MKDSDAVVYNIWFRDVDRWLKSQTWKHIMNHRLAKMI